MLEIIQIPVLQDNYVYLLHEAASGTTAVVDPAVKEPVLEECAKRGWQLTHILNTHHHWDHIGANKALKAETGCQIYGFKGDAERIPGIDHCLEDGDTVTLGDEIAQVIEVHGHTIGHIAYYFEASKALFSGDTLFAMGCGRLFEGTPAQMWESLSRLAALPDDVLVYCAHEYTLSNGKFALSVDPDNPDLQARMQDVQKRRDKDQPTVPFTLEIEKKTNPFLRPASPAIQANLGLDNLKLDGTDTIPIFARIREMKDNF